MTPKSPGGIRSRRAGIGRGLYLAALSCLALAASACGKELTFSDVQTSFRRFSECAVIEDVPARPVELKEAWVQNVVEPSWVQNVVEPSQGGSQKAAESEYLITVARTAPGDRLQRDELASVRVGSGQSPAQSSGRQETTDDPHVVIGIIRFAVDDGPQRDDFTVLLIRKALNKYRVVSWATNVGRKQEERKPLPALLEELRSKPYRGRCSW